MNLSIILNAQMTDVVEGEISVIRIEAMEQEMQKNRIYFKNVN